MTTSWRQQAHETPTDVERHICNCEDDAFVIIDDEKGRYVQYGFDMLAVPVEDSSSVT